MAQPSSDPASLTQRALHALRAGRRFLERELWLVDLRSRTPWAIAMRLLQFIVMVSTRFVKDQLLLRASALTTMAMLSLVPLIALMLAFVGALGVSDEVAKIAIERITPWDSELGAKLLSLVADVQFGQLGTFGAATLLFTTVLAMRHGEQTLNDIWGVVRGRSWTRRFSDYLAVLVVAPVSLAVAVSLRTTFESQSAVQSLLQYPLFELFYTTGLRQAPAMLNVIAFSFIYWFMPNTHVRFVSALFGGAVATFLLTIAQSLYIEFSVDAARTNVLFGTLAQIPLLITWLYFAVAIGLFGAEISFAHQNLTRFRREVQARELRPAEREAIALCMALEVARAFRDRREPWGSEGIANLLGVPVRGVRDLFGLLEGEGIVSAVAADEREQAYQLGRPADDIRVSDVLHAVRGPMQLPRAVEDAAPALETISGVLGGMQQATAGGGGERTLAELLETGVEPHVEPRGPRLAHST